MTSRLLPPSWARRWSCSAASATGAGKATPSTTLGIVHRFTGDYPAAAACHRQALELYGDTDYRSGQANTLMYLGAVQRLAGDYPAAAASLRHALALCRDLGDRFRKRGSSPSSPQCSG